MAGEVIDEAYVEIKAKIDPGFTSDVRKSVKDGIKPVASDVDKALKPVAAAVEESISDAFKDAADAVEDAMDRVKRDVDTAMKSIETDSDAAGRAIEQIEAKITELRAEAARRVALDITADTKDVDAKISALSRNLRTLQAVRPKIEIDVDVDRAGESVREITQTLDQLGEGTQSVLSSVSTAVGGAVRGLASGAAAVASTAGAAAAAVVAVGALAGVIAVLSAAAVTASGVLIPLTGVLGSLGLALGAVVVGSQGVGEALKAQSKAQEELARTGEISEATQQELDAALKGLAPSARQVVVALTEVRSEWGAVQRVVQQTLFEGQAENIRDLADSVLPSVRGALVSVSETLNRGADDFTRYFTTGAGADQLDAILTNLADAFERLQPAIGNIGAGLLNLFVPATKEAGPLADSITRISERFREWTEEVVASGDFEDFITRAKEAATSFGDAIGAVGDVLKTAFGEDASATGVEVLDKITASLQDLNEWLQSTEGQQTLADTFAAIKVAVDAVVLSFQAVTAVITANQVIFHNLSNVVTNTGIVFNNVRAMIVNFATLAGQRITAFVQQAIARFNGMRASVVAAFQNLVANVQARLANLRANISNWIATVVAWFAGLPGRVRGALNSLVGVVRSIFSSVFNAARALVTGGINNVVSQFRALPGKIAALAGRMLAAGRSIGSSIIEGIKNGLSSAAGFAGDIAQSIRSAINSTLGLPFTIGGVGPIPSFTIPALAKGGIVDKETIARIGEAGREVVVPVTNAQRAAQLIVESGLADIPQVQNAILQRLQAMPGTALGLGSIGLDTASIDVLRRSGKPSGTPPTTIGSVPTTSGPTRVVNNNQTQNFIMPPVIDPDALAEAFAARVAEDSER